MGQDRERLDILLERVGGADGVGRFAGRDLELRIDDGRLPHPLLDRRLAEVEPQACEVRLGAPGPVVMNLHHESRARGHEVAEAGRERGRSLSWHPRPQASCGGEARAAEARVTGIGVGGGELAGASAPVDPDEGVMHDARRARPQIDGPHPALLLRPIRKHEAAILVVPLSPHAEGPLRLEDQVRLPQRPLSPGACALRRQVLVVPLGSAPVDPGGDEVDLPVGQAPVVGELVVPGDGVPRRHPAFEHLFLDRLRPRARLGVGGKRHRRDAARAMAAEAILREDPDDLLVEGDLGRDDLVRGTLPGKQRAGERRRRDRDTTQHEPRHGMIMPDDARHL